MTRILRHASILLIIIFLLSSCSYKPEVKNPDILEDRPIREGVIDEGDKIVKGGILKLQSTKPDTFNPLLTNNNMGNAQILGLMFEGLLAYNDDFTLKPLLAERWDISSDGKVWTFHLKQNVRWHDNAPFTAEDVNYSMRLIMNNKYNSIYKFNTQYISSFSIIDKYTFRVVLNRSYSNFLNIMTFPIIAKHQFEGKEDMADNMDFKPIGTGPYKFSEFSSAKEINLTVNTEWWNENTPYIDTIIVKILPDAETVIHSFDAKEVDVVPTKEIDWDKYNAKKNIEIKEFMTNQYEFIAINFRNKVLQDLAVRKAMAYAIDKEKIIKEILLGHAYKTDVPLNTKSWLYRDEYELYNYNIEKAKKILEDGGWIDVNNCGILEKQVDGIKTQLSFKILTNDDNQLRVNVLRNIANQLRAIGMNVIDENVEWSTIKSALEGKNFDAILTGIDLYPNSEMAFAFHSSEIRNGQNYISYNDLLMDNLIEAAIGAVDNQEKIQAYKNLQNHIIDQLPYISLYFTSSAILYNSKLKGSISPTFFNIYEGIENWYMVK